MTAGRWLDLVSIHELHGEPRRRTRKIRTHEVISDAMASDAEVPVECESHIVGFGVVDVSKKRAATVCTTSEPV